MAIPLFEENAGATFARAEETFRTRGDEYGDTWRNCEHLTLRAVYKKLTGDELPLAICRALAAAVLVDVKHQRMEGGYKEDSLVDGINYQAFLVEEMRKASMPTPPLDEDSLRAALSDPNRKRFTREEIIAVLDGMEPVDSPSARSRAEQARCALRRETLSIAAGHFHLRSDDDDIPF